MTDVALVTGGLGFIGSRVVDRLVKRDHVVHVIDDARRGGSPPSDPDVKTHLFGLENAERLTEIVGDVRPSLVIHLAAEHFGPYCEQEPAAAMRVNLVGTQHLLEALEQLPDTPRLVFSSTAAIYGPGAPRHREQDPARPVDIYGFMKKWNEEQLRYWARKHESLSRLGLARLFNVYGPRDTNAHFVPEVVSQARISPRVRLGNLSARRDYVYVDDVAEALVRIGEHLAITPQNSDAIVLNVGTGVAHAGTDVVRIVGDLVGSPLEVVSDPERLRPSDRPLLVASTERLRQVLDWVPPTALEEGLPQAFRAPYAAR